MDLENVFENLTAVVTVEEKEAKTTRLSTIRKGSKDLENRRILEARIFEEQGAHLLTHLGRITPIVRVIGITMVAGITDGRKAIFEKGSNFFRESVHLIHRGVMKTGVPGFWMPVQP
jgi:hypothetical protein